MKTEGETTVKTYFPKNKALAEKGDVEAQFKLGKIYGIGWIGVTKDYKQAFYWFEKAAVQGDTEAQFNLGYMYFNGKGVKRNYEQAIYWTKKAGTQGHADARHNLDEMYRKMPLTAQLAMALKAGFSNR